MRTRPPVGAWSSTRDLGPFHPESDFCCHCKQEIGPGQCLWAKGVLILCRTCINHLFPQLLN